MPRHYLKISKRLRPYAAKVSVLDEDWRRTIFNDLTHGGKELRIVHVAANDQGPLIGLCGERFFCHAGQDKHNSYSLFISRITPSNYRPVSDAPIRIPGEFELITEADWDPPPRDPVSSMFEQVHASRVAAGRGEVADEHQRDDFQRDHHDHHDDLDDRDDNDEFLADHTASEELLQQLETGGPALRERWSRRPAALSGEHSGAALLAALKDLWNRFDIEDHAELEPRPLALLKGTITPSHVSEVDCRDIADAFGLRTLNAMARAAVAEPDESFVDLAEPDAGPGTRPGAEPGTGPILELVRELAELPLDPEIYLAIADAVIHATSRSLLEGEGRQTLQRWIVRQCGATRTSMSRRRHELRNVLEQWLERERKDDPDDLLGFIRKVEQLRERVSGCRDALPAIERVEQRKRDAERAYVHALGSLGDLTVALLEHDPDLTPEALVDVADLFRHRDALAVLPPWLWGESVTYEALAASSSEMVRLQQLADSTQRARSKRACELLTRVDPRLYELVSQYPGPPEDVTPESHFVRMIGQLSGLPGDLMDLPEHHLSWVRHALDESWPPERITPLIKAMDGLRERLDPDTMMLVLRDLEEIIVNMRTPEAAESRVLEYTSAIEQIEALFSNARDATWTQIERLLEQRRERDNRGATATAAGKQTTTGPLLRFDHNWVDETGRRVPLVLVPYNDRERPYGVVRVPLAVRINTPRDVSCEIELEISSSLYKNWPEGWERYSPRSLRIPASAWRESGDEVQYTFPLDVPLRVPKTGKESVDIAVRALDSKSGWPISERKRLRWSRISVWREDIPFSWPDTVHPEFVRQHPIGPQRRFEDIVQRLGSGGSFAVVAPRRFGKTTLVEYLHEQAAERGLAMPPPIVCTGVMGEYGIDYRALWRQVSRGFESLLGVGLRALDEDAATTGDPLAAALPGVDAFEDVRAAARDKGLSAVVVLFDEAQLLFPRNGGDRIGNGFKDRLERSWSRDDLPPVCLGFIGLPGLRERAGANLMGILRPYEGRNVEERALNRLVLQVTRERLSTTREARQRLAQQAGNLYMLKTLVDRLVRHVNHERRTWAAYQDVRLVEAELRTELERGDAGNLTQYMRDPLNRSEDINDWDPRAAYPVAVALAAASAAADSESVREHLDAAADLLDGWCRKAAEQTGHRLTFPKNRMEEHLASLRDLGILESDRFVSPLVRSWLIGVAREFPTANSDARVLERAALPRIRIPTEREPVHAGNGAQVFRVMRDAGPHSLIQIPLVNELCRGRFVQRVDALQMVKEYQRRGEPGSEYLCPIVDAGLAEGANLGVTIHRWIEGVALDSELGHLGAVLILELGSKLASALALLHAGDVVHEHITPAHVVLERASARPVLIDFGLSRIGLAAAQGRRNGVLGQLAAPGQFAPGPGHGPGPGLGYDLSNDAPNGDAGARLGQTADIQALAATLMELWDRAHATDQERDVLELLFEEAAREPSVGIEPMSASGFLRRLDQAGETLGAYRRMDDAWQAIRDVAAAELGIRWFREILDGFQPAFTAMRFGLYAEPFARSGELAVFLSQIAARCPQGDSGHGGSDLAVRTTAELAARLIRAMPTVERDRVARDLDIPDAAALSALVAQAARSLAESAGLPCLPRLVQLLLSRDH